MTKRKSAPKAPAALPAPAVQQAAIAPAAAPSPSPTSVDADGDGHDDNNGQFVAGNQEAANPAPEAPVEPEAPVAAEPTPEIDISTVEQNLIATAEAFLAAAVAFAEVPETPKFYVGEGYRLQFAGSELYSLVAA